MLTMVRLKTIHHGESSAEEIPPLVPDAPPPWFEDHWASLENERHDLIVVAEDGSMLYREFADADAAAEDAIRRNFQFIATAIADAMDLERRIESA